MARRFNIDSTSREAWRSLVDEPLGSAIERYLQNDLLRGLAFTDAKIGVFTYPNDPSLVQNRCFLYHLIGNKTGEWKVPVGGMGAVASELERVARKAGAEISTYVDLRAIDVKTKTKTVEFEIKLNASGASAARSFGVPPSGGTDRVNAELRTTGTHALSSTVEARFLLVNFGRNVLAKFTGRFFQPDRIDEGSVFKINMLLHRLPQQKAKKYPATDAFCGTFHSDEGYNQMNASYDRASGGRFPREDAVRGVLPHADRQQHSGTETARAGLSHDDVVRTRCAVEPVARDNQNMRRLAEKRFLGSVNQWLEEPIEDCLAAARDGRPCIESKSPVDIEDALGMYRGNIFQNAPTWPFAERQRAGGHLGGGDQYENVFLCGSSALRGGAVSGIPGHNAAMKNLEAGLKQS